MSYNFSSFFHSRSCKHHSSS